MTSSSYSIEQCADQLRELSYPFFLDPDQEMILVPWYGRTGIHYLACHIEVTGAQRTLACTISGLDRDPGPQAHVAAALLGLNDSWLLGALSSRPENGMICYRISLPLEGAGPNNEQIDRLIWTAGACVDEAVLVLRAIRDSGATYDEAVQRVRQELVSAEKESASDISY